MSSCARSTNRQASLRIDVDQADRAGARQLRLHRKMAGQVVLPDPPFCDAIARTRILFPSPK
jgi:hypothetical protein